MNSASKRWMILLAAFFIVVPFCAVIFLLFGYSGDLSASQTEDRIVFGATYMTMNNPYYQVLDAQLRLEIEAKGDVLLTRDAAMDQDRLLVVLNYAGTSIGILVDAVDQMIDIPKYNILPMPAHNTQLLVSGMCSLPDGSGTMMVLDCEQLLTNA